ncbi:hypothetical protein AACH06_21925 [Ideonella sp. DXS29W]|uniref:Uncharacterized protein n=1 Tax=Ideonella lacteola TaxID=2984193 RepID=A0ABU9BU39_9BURK
MHTALCEEMFATMGSIGIHERHLQRLLKSKPHLQFGLKYALGQAELTDTEREPPSVVELPGGGLAFQQAVDPLPFDAKDWQIFVRQRNTKAPEHMRCNLDAAKSSALAEEAFNEPLEPDVSSIFLVETSQARIRPDQAHELIASVAPGSARRTRPALTFEVLRYFWDELNNLNAAYVVINSAIKGVGYPVIFNSLSNGKRLTFVPGLPQQHAEYTGYYACCA